MGSQNPFQKTAGFAAILSAIPGLGNIYNGLYMRGIGFFLGFVSLFALAVDAGQAQREEDMAFLIPCVIFFWFFNVFDAYRQATLINYGYSAQELRLFRSRGERMQSGGLMLGSLLFALGFYGLLRKFFRIDLLWILELWPILLMLFGGYLMWQAFKSRKEAASTSSLEEDGDEL